MTSVTPDLLELNVDELAWAPGRRRRILRGAGSSGIRYVLAGMAVLNADRRAAARRPRDVDRRRADAAGGQSSARCLSATGLVDDVDWRWIFYVNTSRSRIVALPLAYGGSSSATCRDRT